MLTDLQTKKLTRYFQVYDILDNGRISSADFARVLENIRILKGESETSATYQDFRSAFLKRWETLTRTADVDHSGTVDLDEWLAYWQITLDDTERYELEVEGMTNRLFRMVDTDEDGVIGANEFCDFYGIFGLGANLARSIFLELDLDQDGAITRAELLEMVRQFYMADDPAAPGNMLFGPIGV